MLDKKTIRLFYKSRFIDSLENDYDQWKMQYSGESGVEYNGPEYTNKEGERIQFFNGPLGTGAYINRQVGYVIGTWEWINSRRLRKAYKNMKKHVQAKSQKETNEKMIKAL